MEVERLTEARASKVESLNPEYLVQKPTNSKSAPLVIYLHGAGGVGNDIQKIKGQTRGLSSGIARFNKGEAYIIAPQAAQSPRKSDRGGWLHTDLNLLLEDVLEKNDIDEKRIYLTGNSMGGYGSWMWGGYNPEHFAAIAPIVGGIGERGPKDVSDKIEFWAANLAKVPVYAFAGAKDKVVPAEYSERMVKLIEKAGGKKAKIKVFPEGGHGIRGEIFANSEYFDWMFSQSK